MSNKKEYHYTIGLYDLICKYVRNKIREGAAQEGIYGIGVYTDRYCEEVLMSKPLKNLEQRMEIVKSLEGVDFVFSVDDINRAEEGAKKAYIEYKKQQEKFFEKQYKVGFIIGSFDMFHTGHIENIKLAKDMCEDLYVILKTDERIMKNKGKIPLQTTAERAAIVKNFKQVKEVLYMDIDTTRTDIIEDILRVTKINNKKDIVAIFGSDLKAKESEYISSDWKDINVVFTERDPEKSKVISSTNYEKQCIINGGIEKIESKEEEVHL